LFFTNREEKGMGGGGGGFAKPPFGTQQKTESYQGNKNCSGEESTFGPKTPPEVFQRKTSGGGGIVIKNGRPVKKSWKSRLVKKPDRRERRAGQKKE